MKTWTPEKSSALQSNATLKMTAKKFTKIKGIKVCESAIFLSYQKKANFTIAEIYEQGKRKQDFASYFVELKISDCSGI